MITQKESQEKIPNSLDLFFPLQDSDSLCGGMMEKDLVRMDILGDAVITKDSSLDRVGNCPCITPGNLLA